MSAHVLWARVSVTIRSKRHDHPEIARSVLGGLHNLKLNHRRQAVQRKETDMRYNTVKTTEMWAKIQAMGEIERNFRNGELWYFNGEYWYLSHLELPPEELREVTEFYSGAKAI